jgi:cobaltochelatase CobN
MHWTASQSGGLDAERDLVLIEQTPGEIVFLGAAESDLAAVAQCWTPRFGSRLRIAHAGPLRQPAAADHYVDQVLRRARVVVVRLLGGMAYFPHLLQALSDLREEETAPRLLLIPGTDRPEDELASLNGFPAEVISRMFSYFREGGLENFRRAGAFLEDVVLGNPGPFPEPERMPEFGWMRRATDTGRPVAWVCFYRAWYQTGDLAVVDALVAALERRGFEVGAFYSFSLRHPLAQGALLEESERMAPRVILTTQSFSMCVNDSQRLSFFERIACPVLQAPVALSSREAWVRHPIGLPPAEIAMNVALPEIDGRVLSTVVGFKEDHTLVAEAEFTVKRFVADLGQVDFVAELARRWARLKACDNGEKKVALILSNYPNRDGRIGNGVGLDTPASTVNVLRALAGQGYRVEPMPADAEQLMAWLQAGPTNDPEHSYGKQPAHTLESARLREFMGTLPAHRLEELREHWPEAAGSEAPIPVPGILLGHVFVGIQPPRGFSQQSSAIYHSPTLPPPPQYLGFYLWIREQFKADAVVHLGKHGNLEWLPGRAVGLDGADYPQLCLGPVPHFYPFIVNNPGEGTQAKRRTGAVIIDHLTPPLTRAGLYGDLEKVERLLEEHAHCVMLYPKRAGELEREIESVLAEASWARELPGGAVSLEAVGSFLCDIKESQIRSALHVLGECPAGEREVDFLLSLLRMPSGERPGLLEALGDSESLSGAQRDDLDQRARQWIASAISAGAAPSDTPALRLLRGVLRADLLPRLRLCGEEIGNLLRGLEGRFVPPGPAGAPTRGRLDVLPTGRNFFAVDPRVVPTPTAWRCGKAMADQLLERHRQEHGEYPRKLALVIWGTSNMRTGGDDIAQALWLWGCEPVWEEVSGRVIDFRILPVSQLRRPRVDVVLRVSGLFRDAFGDTLRLLATVPKRLAELDEPAAQNPIRESWLRDQARFAGDAAPSEEAQRRATLRVFSSEPGAYGTGLLPLLDAGNWETQADLVSVFLKWGGHAFDSDGGSQPEADLLKHQLSQVEVVHQNQDNREHDVLDSDDYFQFQGGLHAAVEQLRGVAPATYHGDSSQPERPRVRTLKEELVRVIRSRVLNPRWIEAMRRHGYKGAFEMAATVDYLFGYGATTRLVEDAHYEEVAQALVLAPEQKAFFLRYNPVALQEASERLLEASERGLWKKPTAQTLAALEETLIGLQSQLE